jgi:hypothetical protein
MASKGTSWWRTGIYFPISCAHLGLGLGDACEEDEVCQEEADAEVKVDGGAGALDGAAEHEGEDAQEQT